MFGWVVWFNKQPSDEIKQIGMDMINNPDNWKNGCYEFFKKDGRIYFWIANGISHLTMNNIKIPMVDRKYINKCMKKSIANRLLNTINVTETKTETEIINTKCIKD